MARLMALAAGTKLGPYEIVSLLGQGGMGEVYRARDSRLGRDVAVKVCAEQFSERFEREARAVAALNHPNICQLYDVGSNFLVMELIEGESPKGPLPVDEALRVARQIASALDAAHSKGIVHRDLKPANIKIKPDGTVKVLDFGLAKTAEAPAGDPENSPTMTVSPTRAGIIMGTAAYMSPEQARGKNVDKRADIWAFGVVFYELLTGARPFHGEDLTEILASVVKDAPDLSKAPAKVQRLLGVCLEKDPEKRLRDIGDVGLLLEEPAVATRRSPVWPWVAAAVLGVALGVGGWMRAPRAKDTPQLTLDIVPPPGVTLYGISGSQGVPEISPDASSLLFRASSVAPSGVIYMRRLDSVEWKLVPGSEKSNSPSFWSPDSTTIVYPTSARQLTKVRMPDGAPEKIAPIQTGSVGGSWSDTGTILFSSLFGSNYGLHFVPASGGEFKRLEVPDAAGDHERWPEFLPWSEDFLFYRPGIEDAAEGSTYLATFRDGRAANPVLLLRNPTPVRYTPAGGGRILFVRNDNLYSQKLNRATRRIEGEAELLVREVASGIRGHFSVARNGTVAWRPGTAGYTLATEFDRAGNVVGTTGPKAMLSSLALSPDERRILASGDWGGIGVERMLLDIGQSGRTELPKDVRWIGWSAGGSELIGARRQALVEMPSTGSGPVREIRNLGVEIDPHTVSRDGKVIGGYGGAELRGALMQGTLEQVKPTSIDKGRASRNPPQFSPDGKWVIYGYQGSSGGGLFVQPFPGPGPRRQISAEVAKVVWRGDGKEILFVVRDTLFSIPVEGSGATLTFGAPRKLFSGLRVGDAAAATMPLAVSGDGSRIFWLQQVEQPESNVIHVKIGAVR